MINVRFELLLNFGEPKVLTPAQSIFQAFGGKPSTILRPEEPGVTIREEQGKHAFNWQYDSCGIIYEDVNDYNECINKFINILEKIHNIAPIKQLSQRVIRTFWILPTKYDFQSLESKFRSTFIKEVPALFSNYFDSTIVIDSIIDSWALRHQSGAMEINQLQKQFRIFKLKEGHPKIFLFLMATITAKDTVDYSSQSMREFIQKAFEICKSQSDNFQKIMEEVL